jgi:hypothetical protein
MNAIAGAFTSKTIWANIAAAASAAFLDGLGVAQIDATWFAGIQSAINIVLRFVTTGSLADKVG